MPRRGTCSRRCLTGTRKKTDISNLFVGSGAFTETQANVFDALVVDEAHRLNEKSGLYGNLGDAPGRGDHRFRAKCAIFFIDEDQRVTWKDIGEKADIERRAKRAGAKVTHLQLASQFRCSGSDGYLAWLDDTLGIRETANPTLDPKRSSTSGVRFADRTAQGDRREEQARQQGADGGGLLLGLEEQEGMRRPSTSSSPSTGSRCSGTWPRTAACGSWRRSP